MIVQGDFTFPGLRPDVWDLLLDPEILSRALPGSRGLEQVGEGRYEGRMNVGVEISDVALHESYVMTVEGKGPVGFTRGRAEVALEDVADGTLMRYHADLQIGGKIAAVGQRLLETVSKAMTRQGLEAISRELEARLASGEPVAAAAASSPAPASARRRRALHIIGVIVLALSLVMLCGPLR